MQYLRWGADSIILKPKNKGMKITTDRLILEEITWDDERDY
jgi:hypothetical protein